MLLSSGPSELETLRPLAEELESEEESFRREAGLVEIWKLTLRTGVKEKKKEEKWVERRKMEEREKK